MSQLNEHILEIRYKPNPKILDQRGKWAEEISAHMKMPDWVVVENRVDIFNKDRRDRAYVGFRSLGYICHGSQTKIYFPDQAVKFMKFVFEYDEFDKAPLIERIGVRSRFCTKYEKTFDDLRDLYCSRYVVLSDKANKAINAKVVDVAGYWNFADDLGNFNTQSGPMISTQISQFFNDVDIATVPEVGLYFDVDYSVKPKRNMKEQEIVSVVHGFAERAWKRNDDLKSIVLEG